MGLGALHWVPQELDFQDPSGPGTLSAAMVDVVASVRGYWGCRGGESRLRG